MKKIYSFLLSLVALFAVATSASATTVNVTGAKYLEVYTRYYNSSYLTVETLVDYDLVDGDNTFDPEDERFVAPEGETVYSFTVLLKVKDGCYMSTAINPTGYDQASYSKQTSIELRLSSYPDGTYTIVAGNYEEARTSKVRIVVDNYKYVRGYYYNGQTINFANLDGANEDYSFDGYVYYDADNELPLYFYGTNSQIPLYGVKLNDTEITVDSSSYTKYFYVTPTSEDDVIYINAIYPEQEVTNKVILPEDSNGDITYSISYYDVTSTNYTTTADEDGYFKVPAGTYVSIKITYTSDWKLDGVYLNDELKSSYSYSGMSVSFFVGTEAQDIEIKAHKLGNIEFNVTVDDADVVKLYTGSSYSPTYIDLVDGENTVSISESITSVNFAAADGYAITSLTKDGVSQSSYTYLSVTSGTKFVVTSAKIVRDYKAVFVADASAIDLTTNSYAKAFINNNSSTYPGGSYIYLTNNEPTVLEFGEVDLANDWQIRITGVSDSEGGTVYVNNVEQEVQLMYGYLPYYPVKPADGDVIKIYLDDESREMYKQTINYIGNNDMDNIIVITDKIVEVADWQEGISCLPATTIEFEGPQGMSIKVDGEDLTAEETESSTLKYSFMTTGAHTIDISTKTDGITNFDASKNDAQKIYNLQGIQVSDNAEELPAGLYIINGRKVYLQ